MIEFGSQADSVLMLALLLTGCVISGKLFHLFKLVFSSANGNNTTHLREL